MREPAIASGRISLAPIKSSPVLVSGTTPISQVWLNFNIWAKFHNFGLNFTISTRNSGTQAAGVVSKSGIEAWGVKIKYGPKGAKDEGLLRLLV